MENHLPLKIRPLKLADQGEVMTGTLLLADCPRLQPLLLDAEGEVTVRLEFTRMPDRRRCIIGAVQTCLILACERCGEPVSCDINVEFKLATVMNDEQAARLPDEYEPLLLTDEDPISLIELVEEEVLLASPMFSKHEPGQCLAVKFNEG